MPKQGDFGFKKLIADWETVKKTLPIEVGDEAVSHFQSNFPEQGFDGQRWKPRKNDKTPGRAILTKSGRLKRSIRRKLATFAKIVISTDVPYAKIHNEGGTINHPGGSKTLSFVSKGKSKRFGKTSTEKQRSRITLQSKSTTAAYQIKMPKRQFMGDSKKLNEKVLKVITNRVGKLFKN
jgi:phage gpG-like protein